MDPNQIAQMLASGDKKQIEAAQRQLQALGYEIKPDGKLGDKTSKAMAAYRAEVERKASEKAASDKAASDAANAATTAGAAKTEAETKELERQRKFREDYERQSGSPEGIATQSAASLIPPAVGTAAGYNLGGLVNERLNTGQARRNEVLKGVAEDRVKGLTTREGAVKGATLAGAMPYENPLLRAASRGAAHIGLGGLSAAKGAELLLDYDPEQPFYSRMADRAAGLGYVGFGGGLLKRGIEQMSGPEVPPDAKSLAIINSSQLRRNGVPGGRNALLDVAQDRGQIVDAEVVPEGQKALPAPENAPKAPTPGTRAAMLAQAKDLQIKGATRMNKADLASAVSNALQEHGGKRTVGKRGPKTAGALGPLAAAGLAYAATPTDANASTDGSVTGQDEALTNAAAAGGISAAVSKALPRGGVAMLGEAMTPAAIDAMTDYSQEDLNTARNWAARNLPEWMQAGAVKEAADMSRVPERSPRREVSVAKEATDRGQVPDKNENRGPAPKLSHPGESSPAPQPRVTREAPASTNSAPPAASPGDFEAEMAAFERILAELGGPSDPASQPPRTAQSMPPMPPAPPSFSMPQNRLLQAAY